jgi:hypothetical protein
MAGAPRAARAPAVARIQIVSVPRESLNELYASPRYARVELKREGDLWRDVNESIALHEWPAHGWEMLSAHALRN